MKTWQEPVIEIHVFGVEDIITTSFKPDTGDQGTPWV